MSTISSKCDELLAMAAYLVVHDLPSVAAVVRDAVDTIWELRDDLQRANDAVRDAEHEESVAWDRVRKAEAESAKLREEIEQWHRLTAGIELPEYPITQFQPKDLERENAKLRDELDRMTEAVEALHSAPLEDQLVQALNVADKLRELVQRMWRLERFGCYGCRRECDAESCYANECKEAVEIEQEMRDLGIEVPR